MTASSAGLPAPCRDCPYLAGYAPYTAEADRQYVEPEVEEYDENGRVEGTGGGDYRRPPFMPGPFFGPGPFFPGPFYGPRPIYGPRPFFGGGFGLPFLTGLAIGGLLF